MLQRKSETRDAAEMSWHAVITPSLLRFFHFERPNEREGTDKMCSAHAGPETCVHDTPAHLNVRPHRPSPFRLLTLLYDLS